MRSVVAILVVFAAACTGCHDEFWRASRRGPTVDPAAREARSLDANCNAVVLTEFGHP